MISEGTAKRVILSGIEMRSAALIDRTRIRILPTSRMMIRRQRFQWASTEGKSIALIGCVCADGSSAKPKIILCYTAEIEHTLSGMSDRNYRISHQARGFIDCRLCEDQFGQILSRD